MSPNWKDSNKNWFLTYGKSKFPFLRYSFLFHHKTNAWNPGYMKLHIKLFPLRFPICCFDMLNGFHHLALSLVDKVDNWKVNQDFSKHFN